MRTPLPDDLTLAVGKGWLTARSYKSCEPVGEPVVVAVTIGDGPRRYLVKRVAGFVRHKRVQQYSYFSWANEPPPPRFPHLPAPTTHTAAAAQRLGPKASPGLGPAGA